MIIRKPYAFLIKYFKIIHITLFFLIIYLVIKTRNLYIFFKDFSSTGTYTYIENMATNYVTVFMIITSIILIGLLLSIFFLMKQKEKKVKFYLFATIFYSVTFLLLIYFFNVFNNLEFNSYSNQSLVLFRDITMVMYYLNYIFLTVSFVRGFGFNVKKFNFEKDLKELDISDEDREEIEVGSGIDYENIGNFVRKRKRNISYYFKENSFILIVFSIILILSFSTYIAFNKFVTNKIYNEGEVVFINDLEYVINSSFIVTEDKKSYYLIVDYNVVNNTDSDRELNINNSKIKIGDNNYYPKTNLGSKFDEYGEVYKKQKIKSNTSNNYILIFELDNDYNNIILELFNYKEEKGIDAIFHYKNISLNLYKFSDKYLGEFKLNNTINLDNTYYKKGNLSIINYEVLEQENYTYKICTGEICKEYNRTISASGKNKILKIEYKFNLEKDIFNYLKVETNNIKKDVIKNITPNNYMENMVLLEINDVEENINLFFDIKGVTFRVTK